VRRFDRYPNRACVRRRFRHGSEQTTDLGRKGRVSDCLRRVVLLGRSAAGEAVMGASPSMSRRSKSRLPCELPSGSRGRRDRTVLRRKDRGELGRCPLFELADAVVLPPSEKRLAGAWGWGSWSASGLKPVLVSRSRGGRIGVLRTRPPRPSGITTHVAVTTRGARSWVAHPADVGWGPHV
jgi:hypothetical protein